MNLVVHRRRRSREDRGAGSSPFRKAGTGSVGGLVRGRTLKLLSCRSPVIAVSMKSHTLALQD